MQLSERFEQALVYTARLHRVQRRKISATPYIGHLLAVSAIVLEHGGCEDEAIAALLHDSIEDQGGAATREEIRRSFGESVVAIVDGCTDTDISPKPPWKDRKLAPGAGGNCVPFGTPCSGGRQAAQPAVALPQLPAGW